MQSDSLAELEAENQSLAESKKFAFKMKLGALKKKADNIVKKAKEEGDLDMLKEKMGNQVSGFTSGLGVD
jgi:hypothetical protein